MVSRWKQVLARIDLFIGGVIGYHFLSAGGSEYSMSFYQELGPEIAVVDADGKVVAKGGFFWVVHYYDGGGNLIERIPRRKMLRLGERLVLGQRNVFALYKH